MTPATPAAKPPRYYFELLALRLALHGLDGQRPLIRRVARTTLYLELRSLLREHGFPENEINVLVGDPHPQDCACWSCVRKLRDAIKRRR